MTEASVSVESRAAGGGDLCSSSFGVRMGCMDGRIVGRPAKMAGGWNVSGAPMPYPRVARIPRWTKLL